MGDSRNRNALNAGVVAPCRSLLPSPLELFQPSDVEEVRRLHEACFPLKYDEHFYQSLQNGVYCGRDLFSVVVPSSSSNCSEANTAAISINGDADSGDIYEGDLTNNRMESTDRNTIITSSNDSHACDMNGYATASGTSASQDQSSGVGDTCIAVDRFKVEYNESETHPDVLIQSLEQVNLSTSESAASSVASSSGSSLPSNTTHTETQHIQGDNDNEEPFQNTSEPLQNTLVSPGANQLRQIGAGAIAQVRTCESYWLFVNSFVVDMDEGVL
jgi:hypothetical protein